MVLRNVKYKYNTIIIYSGIHYFKKINKNKHIINSKSKGIYLNWQ